MRRAKIVCTLGPSTTTYDQIRDLVDAGMDVARLNMSHGTHEEHYERYCNVRKASDDAGHAVGIMADLQGPKVRLGKFPKPVMLERDALFRISIDQSIEGSAEIASTTHIGLPGDARVGEMILVDDGKIQLIVEDATDTEVLTRVAVPGRVGSFKGINLPGVAVSVPALSDKDERDLRWALRTGVDLIALSFVRCAEDRKDVDAVMDDEGITLPVIAKIEKPQAVQDIEAIVSVFDAIMVARGDLGVELPLEEVPLVQKQTVAAARRKAKPVIVATQVLESMVSNPRPTRAEASDAANAILDGADALMLSGETSVGEHPTTVVDVMSSIIENTEEHGLDQVAELVGKPTTRSGVVTRAASEIAEMLDVKYLVTFTVTGGSARRLARLRPHTPILAFTPNQAVRSQMALTWGIETFISPRVETTDEMVAQVDSLLQEIGRVEPGDVVIICAGSPPGIPGTTNDIRVHTIGDASI